MSNPELPNPKPRRKSSIKSQITASCSTMYQATLHEESAGSDAGQASMSIADTEKYQAYEPDSYEYFLKDDHDEHQVRAHNLEFMYAGAHPGVDIEVGRSVNIQTDACLLELEEMTKQQPVMGSSQQSRYKKVRFTSGTKDVVNEGGVNGTRTEASSDTDLDECIMTARRAIGNEFWRAPATQAGSLWDSEEWPSIPNNGVAIARRIMSRSLEARSPEVDQTGALVKKPETRPGGQERAHQDHTTYHASKFNTTGGDGFSRLKSPSSNRALRRDNDESSLPPKRNRARAPTDARNTRAFDTKFQRDPIAKPMKLWSPEEEPLKRKDNTESPRPTRSIRSFEPRSPEADQTEVLIKQPETRPITQEQLVAEVKGIYAGLVMVESKCIEVDNAQSSTSDTSPKLNNEQWRHLVSLHRPALRHLGLFRASSSAPIKSRFSSGATDYIVEGSANGVQIEASPDTGSDECIISSHFASKLGKDPVPGTGKTMTLANKKEVWSPGMVEVLWKFANDQTSHLLNCWILPDSSKEFVLGSRFLKMTGTLTKFFHRVKKVILPSRLRLRLMGEEKQRVLGMFNNRTTTAQADTGSDMMLVSSDYVKRRGLVIKTGRKYRTEVELADGTRTWTCGTVRKATWTLENRSVRCDFHVLEGLPADVILSKDYLFDLNVFSNYAESFFDIDSEEGISLLCGIRLVEQEAFDLYELESDFPRTVTSTFPDAFNSQAAKRERRRRTLADKMIERLPVSEKSEATRVEVGKRQRWDMARLRHKDPSRGQQPVVTIMAGQGDSSQSSRSASETNHQIQGGGQASFELVPR